MEAIVDTVLPVFAIMLAGHLTGRSGLLGPASSEALNRFVYFVALPALFFISMASVEIDKVFHGPFLVAFGGGMLASFGLTLVAGILFFPNRLAALGLQGLCTIFSNTGYLGIPLLIIVFGEAGKLPAIIATVTLGAVVMPLGIVLVELDLGQGVHPLRLLRNVVLAVAKSPLVLSAAAGVLASGLGVSVPGAFATFCEILGSAAAPCALFAIGLFLAGHSYTAGAVEVGWLVAVKLLVQPALTWWLAYRVLTMEPMWAASAVIQAALPTGALVFVLAQHYGIYVQRATAAIMVSTVLSVVTVSALFVMLRLP